MRHLLLASFALLFLFQSVAAHNWLTSPARGNKNNNFNGFTSPPCPAKGNRVHVQIGPGQRFPVEWASGHGYGSFTFLVLMSANEESNMIKNTFELLNDYLANAPPAALQYMSDDKAVHVSHAGPSTQPSFDREITNTRPAVFRTFANARVYAKKASYTANDRRAAYKSDKYPWLISVSKFALHEDLPEDMDSANIEIPAGYPSGQYVVQYLWNGYYDCTDINYLDVRSTDLWGKEADVKTIGYDKINHCQYNQTLGNYRVFDCYEVGQSDTIEQCANACTTRNGQYDGCDGVIVTPATLPASAKFRGRFTAAGNPHLPRECETAIKNIKDPSTASLCYTFRSGDPPLIGPPYKIVSDPEDSVFYSTCYQKRAPWQFAQQCTACVPPPPRADFRFGSGCITCKDMNRNYFTNAAPFWKLSDVCEDCDSSRG